MERRIAAVLRGELARQQRKHADLAMRLGVSRNHLSRMLNGHVHINLDELDAMCRYLGLSTVEVVGEAERSARSEEYGPLAALQELRAELDEIGPYNPDAPDERPEAG